MMATYKLTPKGNAKLKISIQIENTRKTEKETCYVPSCCNQLKPDKKGSYTKQGWYTTQQLCNNPECKNFGKQTTLAKGVLGTENEAGKVKVLPKTAKKRSGDRDDQMTIEGSSKMLEIDHELLAQSEGLYKVTANQDSNFEIFQKSLQGKMAPVSYDMMGNQKKGWIYGHNGEVYLTPVSDQEIKQAKKQKKIDSAVESITEELVVKTTKPTITEEQLAEAFNI